MKNSLKYLKLWQKKRDELHVDADGQADWLQMQSLLDMHMPVVKPPAGPHTAPIKGFKLISLLWTGVAAAAITGAVWYGVKATKHKHNRPGYSIVQNPAITKINSADSVSNNENVTESDMPDSLTAIATSKDNLHHITLATAKPSNLIDKKGAKFASKSDSLADEKALLKSNRLAGNKVNWGASAANASVATGSGKSITVSLGTNKAKVSTSPLAANSNGIGTSQLGGAGHSGNSKLVTNTGHGAKSSKGSSTGLSGKNGNSQIAVTNGASSHSTTHNNGTQSNGNVGESPKYKQNTFANQIDRINNSNVNEPNRSGLLNNLLGDERYGNTGFIQAIPPKPSFNFGGSSRLITAGQGVYNKQLQLPQTSKSNKNDSKTNAMNSKPSSPSNVEWGMLMGFNSAGSFTPKVQNSNFYGSLPVDPFFGLFANYNLNANWAIGTQLRILNPQKISGSYTHANGSKVDTGQMIKVTDSRKTYTVDIPLHVIYKVNDNLSIKAGPVFSIPVKQLKGSASVQPAGIKTDTNYYSSVIKKIDSVKYQSKFNYGMSAGVSYRVNRFIFGIDYLKNLGGYQVNSGFGNYKSHNGTVQVTIGFKLGKK